jgi:serine/threonine-protein kinase HipA
MRTLNVYVDRKLVGVLFEGEDLWRFEYDEQWATAADGFDLAPGMSRAQREHADGGTIRPVQWYFDNLLPEELLRQAISKEAGIKGDDAFALLEYLGAESAGSLTLLPPGQPLPDLAAVRALSDERLSERIAGLARQTLTAGAPKRMSLAGAQHKLLVVLEDGKLFEPEGATPSTHILKPNHPDAASYPASVLNEYVTMRIAGAAGLSVPPVHIRYVPQAIYIIDRFDRRVTALGAVADGFPRSEVQRLHIIDACQLLTRARTFKHSGASLEALRNVIGQTTNKTHSRTNLFRWLVFNIVMGNDDSHLKNLSFYVDPDGTKLAPHYDLLTTGAYYTRAFANEKSTWPNVTMAIPLPGAKMFGEVTKESVLNAGRELGLAPAAARRILAEVAGRIPAAVRQERQAMERRHAALAPEVRKYLGSEVRLIDVMEKIVIQEMLGRVDQ